MRQMPTHSLCQLGGTAADPDDTHANPRIARAQWAVDNADTVACLHAMRVELTVRIVMATQSTMAGKS